MAKRADARRSRHDADAGGDPELLAAKAELRERVWADLDQPGVARFPKPANRIPEAIRLRIVGDDGPLPEMAVRISLGEEAGCLENAFQRNCRPRRQ
jgi:hypothetical protein